MSKSPNIARLQKELIEVITADAQGITAFPENDNLCHWIATITGVDNTAYEGLEFEVSMKFSEKYPFEAPLVMFKTPCFHPNISTAGDLCLDILKENWTASYTALQILLSVQSLLDSPNIHSPLNNTAASLWANQEEFSKVVRSTYDAQKHILP
eukprot:Tbor_TRINITY_DN1915_c0_g1::TRINITY_DN1915_c0_g1_i1::g.3548::m.3548/K06688/UBE2C, UBC11; ubiquitin-conjugating enzyme E2 C